MAIYTRLYTVSSNACLSRGLFNTYSLFEPWEFCHYNNAMLRMTHDEHTRDTTTSATAGNIVLTQYEQRAVYTIIRLPYIGTIYILIYAIVDAAA